MVSKRIINEGSLKGNKPILTYLEQIKNLELIKIERPINGLAKIYDKNMGVILEDSSDRLIWRMNNFTYQYPSTCEHVSFHAAMIAKGYDKLFINPRMRFFYGDRKPIGD